MNMRRSLPRAVLILLLAAMTGWAIFHRDQVNLGQLDTLLTSFGAWAPVAYVTLFALATVAFVPGVVFSLAGGALFGPFWGTLWNLSGATLGAILAFLIARYIAGDFVARQAGGLLKRLMDGIDAEGWRFVAFIRLVPLFPFNLSNYALGLTRIPFRQYGITTLVCMIPGAVAYTWLGHAGRGALSGDADAAVRYGLLALGLLAAIAVLPRLIGEVRGRVAWIEVNELKRRLDRGDPVTVVDVRGPAEFTGPLGHIANAHNIPITELNSRLAELSGLERAPIVLVCRTDKRSAAAAGTLRAAGFSQINVLRRGMERWNESGLPVVEMRS